MAESGCVACMFGIVSVICTTLAMNAAGCAQPLAPPSAASAFAPQRPADTRPATATIFISGTVIDDQTGLPIPNFTVTWGDNHSIPYWQQDDAKPFAAGQFSYGLPEWASLQDEEYRIAVRARGYSDAASRVITLAEGSKRVDFRLVRPERFTGVVRLPDGAPVAGASVRVVNPGEFFAVHGDALSQGAPIPPEHERQSATTDAAGRFGVNVGSERCRIVVLHDRGSAEFLATRDARKAGGITLQPWGAVVCDVNLAGRAAADVKVCVESREDHDDGSDDGAYVEFDSHATTDAQGRCKLSHVLPGKAVVAVYRPIDMGRRDQYFGNSTLREAPLEIPAGGEVAAAIGGGGANISGRFTAEGRDIPWKYAIAQLHGAWPKGVHAPKPVDWRDEVMMRRDFPVDVRPDGTFFATDVPPGYWRLDAMVFVERSLAERVHHAGDVLHRFSIPAPEDKNAARPTIDLGDLPVTFRKDFHEGDRAPDFEVTTLDGKKLRLSELRGKYVLLDFWATWCGPCKAEMPFLKKSWESLKDDKDVVILGLSVDETADPVRPFVAKNGYGWPQAVIGESSKITDDYGVTGFPTVWLVLPDGTLATAHIGGLAEQIAKYRNKPSLTITH